MASAAPLPNKRRDSSFASLTLQEIKRSLNNSVPASELFFISPHLLTLLAYMGDRRGVSKSSKNDSRTEAKKPDAPAIRQPVMFYSAVVIAFGFIAMAILALLR
jgi:hypothetical protein